MVALRFYDQRDIRLEDIPKPSPKKGEVLIRVTDAGLSQTQINEFVEGPFIINKTPHPLTNKAAPLIPCQEYGGIIEEVGEGVDTNLIGKQVAVLPLRSCGCCSYCRNDQQQLCAKMAYYGLLGLDGGFCEYSVVHQDNIFITKDRTLLTFIEPILVAIHAAHQYERFQPLAGKKVLILGAGAIGITLGALFRDHFQADITINDILPSRLNRAAQAGLKTASKKELSKEFDLVVDAAGMDTLLDRPAIVEGFDYLKRGAPLLNIGTYFHPVPIIPSSMLLQEHCLIESIAYNQKDIELLPQALQSLKIDFKPLIDTITLDKIIEEGYYRAEVDKESFTRIVVRS